jgi:multidrug efflux pump subunit AcrA (membrane-fusion protein)
MKYLTLFLLAGMIASCGGSDHAQDTASHAHDDGDHAHDDGDHAHDDGDHAHDDGDHAHDDGDHAHDDGDHAHDDGDHAHDGGDHAHDDGDHAHEVPGEIELPEAVRRNLGIRFARAERRVVEGLLRIPGAFELEPLARREYRMALPGRVELLVDQYDTVAPGDILFRFQSPAWPELMHEILQGEQAMEAAGAEILVASATLEEARGKLQALRDRLAALTEANFRRADLIAEERELESALPRLEAELELARTRLGNAVRTREHALHRAALASGIPEDELEQPVPHGEGELPRYRTVDWIDVVAADAGVVEALAVTSGAFVEPPAMVLSTVDPARVRFRAVALQGDVPRLSGVGSARIVPPQSSGLPVHEAIEAEVALGLEAHPEERTLELLARPRVPGDWSRPGVSAFLEVVVDGGGLPVVAIPSRAVVRDGLEHVFFLRERDDPDHVRRVAAHLGASDGRWIEVLEGVAEGDEVVLDGAYELKLATQLAGAAPEGGHVHADGSVHEDH